MFKVPYHRLLRSHASTRAASSFVERCRLQESIQTDEATCRESLKRGQFLLMHKGQPLLNKKTRNLFWANHQTVLGLNNDLDSEFVFLGLDAESSVPLFACPVPDEDSALGSDDGLRFVNLRLAMFTIQDDDDDRPAARPGVMLASKAWSLLRWHRKSGYCSNCGHQVSRSFSGSHRPCKNCGEVNYPRTSPVGIALPSAPDDSRVLLIRQPMYPPGMYSCVAGFVDVGESLENCVRREVAEEVGMEVNEVRVRGSQHWPFPTGSLMVGCEAVLAVGDQQPSVDGNEIEEARWFSPEELRSAFQNSLKNPSLRLAPDNDPKNIFVPPKQAIAHRLIKGWLSRNGHLSRNHSY
jgi:NADH pyrophosphatase NudC (nudix superfamily)